MPSGRLFEFPRVKFFDLIKSLFSSISFLEHHLLNLTRNEIVNGKDLEIVAVHTIVKYFRKSCLILFVPERGLAFHFWYSKLMKTIHYFEILFSLKMRNFLLLNNMPRHFLSDLKTNVFRIFGCLSVWSVCIFLCSSIM